MKNADTATTNLASFQYGPYGTAFYVKRCGDKYVVQLEDGQTPGTEDVGVAEAFDYLTERFRDVEDDDAACRLANKLDGSF